MTLGVGVDIVQLSRMKDTLETGGKAFLAKTFTPLEQQRSSADPDPVARLAMAFAAKEAVFKAFAAGWDEGMRPTDVEIREGPNGEPLAVLGGRFAELAAERGVSRVLVSLSFDGDYAIATAALT